MGASKRSNGQFNQRNLRSIITSELPGYGAKGRYLSELGVKTMRDGSISLSEADFNKAFEKELYCSTLW